MVTKAKKIALTFDDGPNPPYTNQVLDILKKENVKAAFFVCGANVKRHPEVVKRIAKEGHLVGNHTYNHQKIKNFLGLVYKEIRQTQKLIDQLAPQKEKLFRGPWGLAQFWLKRKLQKDGYIIVGFNGAGHDWETNITSQQIAQNIIKKINSGESILLHDGHNTDEDVSRAETVKALPAIIKDLKIQSYRFVFPTELE